MHPSASLALGFHRAFLSKRSREEASLASVPHTLKPYTDRVIHHHQQRAWKTLVLFTLLIGLLLFLGIGFLSANLTAKPPVPPSVSELRVSGIFAFIATAALWYRAAEIVLAIGKTSADQATMPTSGVSPSVTSS